MRHHKDYRYEHCTGAKVNRDNKHAINGEGFGGSYPTYRYPSKKRSKKTWANFYKLFPDLAERDNWDGKTSDKMK